MVPLGSHTLIPICCNCSSISGNSFGIVSELEAYALKVLVGEENFVLRGHLALGEMSESLLGPYLVKEEGQVVLAPKVGSRA